jgi:hypothetical protein
VLNRPRLWRATAVCSALLLALLLVVTAPGGVTVLAAAPARAGSEPAWAASCRTGQVRPDRRRLAYCARVDGRVVAASHGPSVGEAHVAVLGGFHLTIVLVPPGASTPGLGSRIVAVGPLLRSRTGQREVQAFSLR